MFKCLIECNLGCSDAHSNEHHALVLEVTHGLVEAAINSAEHLIVRNPHVVKHEFGGVRATPSVFVEFLRNREAFRTRWNEEHGDAVAVFGAGASRNDGHVSVHRVRDVGLGSVDSPPITITHRRGTHAGHVAAGVRFRHTDRKDRLSRQHSGQPVIELLFRS